MENFNIKFLGSTKAALDMLTKSMALELGPHQVSDALCPIVIFYRVTFFSK